MYRSSTHAEESIKEISVKYFTQQTVQKLLDPVKCAFLLQRIMTDTSHMENLSDLVAICFVFTYKNLQSQPQAIGLIRYCMNNDFHFEDEELDLIVQTMFDNPPSGSKNIKVCSQIVSLICKQSQFCAKLMVDRYRSEKYSQEQVDFLTAIAKEIALDPLHENFTKGDIETISSPLIADPSSKEKKKMKKTPTAQKIKKAEMENKINSISSKVDKYQGFMFAIFTILLVLLVILIL